MPELPEVETYRKYLDRHTTGKRISSAGHIDNYLFKKAPDPAGLAADLKDRVITSSNRHGKYVFLEISGPKFLILHFGMTGYPRYLEDCQDIPSHTRLLLKFDGSCLAMVDTRRLGMIYLYDDMDAFLHDKKLGADALSIKINEFIERLSKRKKPVKSALMDQSIIAGIGNLYADEILFQSHIHPLSLCSHIDMEKYTIIYKKMRHVLALAVEKHADIKKYPQGWLLSCRRKGGTCPHCGSSLKIIKVGGRTTYLCSRRQKLYP
jgi:formamidopyrimidine-DNA glycosylase